jgi:hypothetical protein
LIVGLGGVIFAAEFWLEQEWGAMTIEMVDITNINRQLPRYIPPWTAKK